MSDDEPLLPNAVPIEYCPTCTLPPEYCEYGPKYEKCKVWLRENHPEFLPEEEKKESKEDSDVKEVTDGTKDLVIDDEEKDEKNKKKTKRGGKGNKVKGGPEKEEKPKVPVHQFIHISKSQRNKRKFITVMKGCETFGLKPKDVAKSCSKKFACSGSVGKSADGSPEISIQGDVMLDLPSFLRDDLKIPAEKIFFKNGAKLSKAS